MEIPGSDSKDSPFQQILRYHEFIFAEGHQEWCERSLNFMVYDLTTQKSSAVDVRSSDILDEFFFRTKRFQIQPQALPPRQVLSEKRGPGIFIALLYCHLAESLGLNTQILNWPHHHYVRRTCPERTVYVDLDQNGKIVTEDELIALLTNNQREHRMLSPRESCVRYLRTIVRTLKETEHHAFHHRTLNILLNAEPENTKWLAERAILRKQMGLLKESLQDLKRYFAFVEKQSASKEVIEAYDELLHAPV